MAKRGPNTPNGKAASSKNAITHGLASSAPVIPGESIEDWIAFRDGVIEDCDPQGTLERAFAVRIASLLWRLERVVRFEVGAIIDQVTEGPGYLALAESYANLFERPPKDLQDYVTTEGDDERRARAVVEEADDGDDDETTPEEAALAAELRVIPRGFYLDRILRYEPHIHRMLTQTIHELEARQSRRRGEKPHLARLDVSGAP